ncbi:MAG: hypothetical protein EOO13_09005 [Chitinophagaceae bacterium]|nr:MAG: hypothetical protein EOO13_09005 [Chitinophagaceae bacterium]
MKNLFSCMLLLLITTIGYSQKVTPCGYIIPPKSSVTKFQSVYEARELVDDMLDKISWNENFTLREQNGIQNAYATISAGRRLIVYDNNFLEDIDAYAKTKWASYSIMAHEMGHHFYNHVVSNQGSTIPSELEADAFSGFMVQKLGGTLEQAIAAMQTIGTPRASATHPAKADRINAITRGWNAAKTGTPATSANSGNNVPPPKPTPAPGTGSNNNPGTNAADDPSWIALTIQSNKTETVQLSDDGKKFQPAEIKAGEAFVFKFEIYQYGWLRLPYYNGFRTFKLMHGKDYNILYNRRNKNWTVVEVPE